MHCLTCCSQKAREAISCTGTPPLVSGHSRSCNTLPRCLQVAGSATFAVHGLTARGQWRVQFSQCTAPLPWCSGQWNSCNALLYSLTSEGSATSAITYDFTGENVTLIRTYLKAIFWTPLTCLIGFSTPRIGGVLTKTFPKPSFTHFFHKNGPRGGVYHISPDVALTTCIHLHSKSTQRANLWTRTACFLDSARRKLGGSS